MIYPVSSAMGDVPAAVWAVTLVTGKLNACSGPK